MGFWVTLRWAEAGAAALRGVGEKCSRCRETGVQFAPKWVFTLPRNQCSLCSEICKLSNSLTRGFGYGLWPGESAAPGAMLHLAKAYPTQVILVFTSASPAKPAPLLSPSCRILR
jgi:hypothetical protein